MKQDRTWRKTVTRWLMCLVGNALDAMAVAVFTLPFNIIIGGVSGIGRVVNAFWDLPISVVVAVINAALLAVSFFLMGRAFAATIIVGSVSFPVFLELFGRMTFLQQLTDDPLVATLFAGLLSGIGIGLVLRCGGATSGSEVPAILHAKLGIPVGISLNTIEILILVLQLLLPMKQEILLGILYVLIYTVITDKMMLLGTGQTQLLVFSPAHEKICESLLTLDYGVTLFHTQTGFRGEDQCAVLCIIPKRQLHRAKETILAVDSTAFITVSSVQEVSGRGFSLKKVHLQRTGEY